jgi:hypothetical protein
MIIPKFGFHTDIWYEIHVYAHLETDLICYLPQFGLHVTTADLHESCIEELIKGNKLIVANLSFRLTSTLGNSRV